MALTWRYDVEDLSSIGIGENGDQHEKVVSEALVWASMAVGYNGINETNWTAFYARVSFYEKVVGDTFVVGHAITPEDVYKRIGLTTNVPNETERQFLARVGKNRLTDLRREAEKFQTVSA